LSKPSIAHDPEIAKFRRDIVNARIQLASANLTADQRRELWQIIECREWFIKSLSGRYEAELEKIDRELEAALRR
jgi:hypothetical protein